MAGATILEFHYRKTTRIPKFNYSGSHYYFITVCTHEKEPLFGKPNGLNVFGLIAKECMEQISEHYANAEVLKFVIMPNHVHAIIHIKAENAENVIQIVGQYKMVVTKRIRQISPAQKVWQRSFHDHVIRNTNGYLKIWEYIENNPLKWEEDCFYRAE